MASDETYERLAYMMITPEQERLSALRVGLNRMANVGMKAEWQLRSMGKTVTTETELEQALTRAKVPSDQRTRVAARIRPYSRIEAP